LRVGRNKAIEPFDIELAGIPAELVQDLPQRARDAAEMGNVSALMAIAEELNARSDACTPLSNRIVQLAEDFNFEGIIKLADDLDAHYHSGFWIKQQNPYFCDIAKIG